eukprot:1293295-Rhodomonas_salina.2
MSRSNQIFAGAVLHCGDASAGVSGAKSTRAGSLGASLQVAHSNPVALRPRSAVSWRQYTPSQPRTSHTVARREILPRHSARSLRRRDRTASAVKG